MCNVLGINDTFIIRAITFDRSKGLNILVNRISNKLQCCVDIDHDNVTKKICDIEVSHMELSHKLKTTKILSSSNL